MSTSCQSARCMTANRLNSNDSKRTSLSVIGFVISVILSLFLIGFIPQTAFAEPSDPGDDISAMATSNDPAVYDIQNGSASHAFYNSSYIANYKFKITKATKVELTFSFNTSKSSSCTFSLYKGDSKLTDLGIVMKSSSSLNNGGYSNSAANLTGDVVSKGSGLWVYSATLEPGDYYVKAQVFSSVTQELGNYAWVQMKTVTNSSQASSGATTSGSNSANNSSANNSAKPGASSGAQASAALSGKWIHGSKGWWYSYSDGGYAKSTLKKIGNATYYFDNNGWMKTGWQKIDNNWYYFGSKNDGAMKTKWQKVSGKWYYMASDGKMLTGKQTIDKKVYFLAGSGAMRTGWVKDGGNWYYCKSSGDATTGWQKVKGTWYYMNSDYTMAIGWVNDGKAKYYMQASGAMSKGWKKIGSSWYYFLGSGAMKTNAWISGKYWVGSDGIMATNAWVDNNKYYVDGKGVWEKNKKPSSSTSQSLASDQLIGSWNMTALTTTGSDGLTPILKPSSDNSIKVFNDSSYALTLTTDKSGKSSYTGTWKFLESKNGSRYYDLTYRSQPIYYASISSAGSLVLMSYLDTDMAMCFEKNK